MPKGEKVYTHAHTTRSKNCQRKTPLGLTSHVKLSTAFKKAHTASFDTRAAALKHMKPGYSMWHSCFNKKFYVFDQVRTQKMRQHIQKKAAKPKTTTKRTKSATTKKRTHKKRATTCGLIKSEY